MNVEKNFCSVWKIKRIFIVFESVYIRVERVNSKSFVLNIFVLLKVLESFFMGRMKAVENIKNMFIIRFSFLVLSLKFFVIFGAVMLIVFDINGIKKEESVVVMSMFLFIFLFF